MSFSPKGFDIMWTAVHHGQVRVLSRVLLVTAAALLMTWHGIMLSLPHSHADVDIPQEELACSASHPLSGSFHLHGAGEVLNPHHCLAMTLGIVISEYAQPAAAVTDCRSHGRFHLPLHRGPPTTV